MVVVLCAGFTSCSDDDDENPLVGTWVSIENRNSMEYKEVMTINENGTGSSANYTNGQLDKDGVENLDIPMTKIVRSLLGYGKKIATERVMFIQCTFEN